MSCPSYLNLCSSKWHRVLRKAIKDKDNDNSGIIVEQKKTKYMYVGKKEALFVVRAVFNETMKVNLFLKDLLHVCSKR